MVLLTNNNSELIPLGMITFLFQLKNDLEVIGRFFKKKTTKTCGSRDKIINAGIIEFNINKDSLTIDRKHLCSKSYIILYSGSICQKRDKNFDESVVTVSKMLLWEIP